MEFQLDLIVVFFRLFVYFFNYIRHKFDIVIGLL
jgi:hypothetical protein